MATSMIPPGSLAKPSPHIPRTNPFMLETDPLCALWAYFPGFVNMMAIIVTMCIDWLKHASTTHPKPM